MRSMPTSIGTAPQETVRHRRGRPRLGEIDALRGVAALAVVLFHYSTRFHELYPELPTTSWQVPHGHYGVNLFFIISGFVIFMTLERTQVASDFVISRFSRLFPMYWAAVALTFVVTHWLGLPGKLVSLGAAAANVLMFHNLLGVPHVDGVYWTLEVELYFYCGMLLLFLRGGMHRVFEATAALLLVRWAYFIAHAGWGIDLSFTVGRLLILKQLPWFVLGIAIYVLTQTQASRLEHGRALVAGVFAVVTLAVTDSLMLGALAAVLAALVWLAASGRLPLPGGPLLPWLGSISYPLYLLHENVGWSLMRKALLHGWSADMAAAAVLLAMLGLAHLASRGIEQPAMRWVRQRWHARKQGGHGTA